jgi:hypothetical protein
VIGGDALQASGAVLAALFKKGVSQQVALLPRPLNLISSVGCPDSTLLALSIIGHNNHQLINRKDRELLLTRAIYRGVPESAATSLDASVKKVDCRACKNEQSKSP